MTSEKMTARERLIFALDVSSAETAVQLARSLKDHVGCFKVGLELFTSTATPRLLVRTISDLAPVFLDLKLHDIPTTVGRTAKSLNRLGVKYTTVHVGDDGAGIAAAVDAAPDINVLAVTVLTSVKDPGRLVQYRVDLARRRGAYGVICSANDLSAFHNEIHCITPGIRLPDQDAGDQARVATPEAAIEAGAHMIVVGRPIRDAKDPAAAADEIVRRMEMAKPVATPNAPLESK